MATWEDGPEYAPLERPSGFELAQAAPLEQAPVVPQPAAYAPLDRPRFGDPAAPVAPLATLVPDVSDPRDPHRPFEVAASAMTSDSAWGALQPSLNSPQPGPLVPGSAPAPFAAPTPAAGPWGPPAPAPWPGDPAPATVVDPRAPVGFPAPGTPAWFGPGPYAAPPEPEPVGWRQVLNATTPGLCICLVIGGLFVLLAPVMLSVGFALSRRVTAAQEQVRRVFVGAVAGLGLLAVVGALAVQTGFADWWDFVGRWALFFCWLTLALTLGLVYRALRSGPPAPPAAPRRSTWG